MDTLQLMKESAFHAENEESVACKGFNIPATGAASDVRVGSQAAIGSRFVARQLCATFGHVFVLVDVALSSGLMAANTKNSDWIAPSTPLFAAWRKRLQTF